MDKEFSEVFQEEIVNEGKIEELGKQIAGIADKFKEGKDDVMTMADEMISQGNMPDPEAIKMLENEEADMVIHLIAKKMGVQWTKDNGYGEMRMKQNYPESTDMVMNLLGKKKVVVKEDKDLEKIVKELEGASKMHLAQSKRIQKHLDKMENGEVEVDEGNARVDRLKMIDKLKMSKLSPKQKKALEKEEVEEAKMKPDMIDTLKKKYESLRGKRLSLGQNMEIAKIVSGMSRDKEVLLQLVKADIPFISLNAATLLMDKHGMKAKDINLTNEEVEITESGHTDVASAKNQVKVAKSALQKMEMELSKLPDEGSLPSWWTNKVAIAVDKLDGMADYLGTQVSEAFKPHKMYDPKTGKAYDADTEEDHLRYKKIGYTHEKPQVEALEKEGAAEFMAAASAAKKEGKKKFKFGGKEYPVTIKVDIPLANEEIANSVGGGGIAGLDTGLTAKKKRDDTDKAKKLRKQYLKGAGITEEVQRSTFAGKDVFIVDSDTFHNCRMGKKKYGRYETYVGDGEVGQTIREYGLKYPRRPIILQNGDSGPMLYLKYGRS